MDVDDFLQIPAGRWFINQFNCSNYFDCFVLFLAWRIQFNGTVSSISARVNAKISFSNKFKLKFDYGFCSVPWNEHTLVGYIAELSYHVASGVMYLLSETVFMLLFISLCLHHRAFYKMFCHSLNEINEHLNDTKIGEQHLVRLIRFYVTVKE